VSERDLKTGLEPGFVWWKHGVIYQVYPRSFQDSNDDGIGDLDGLISRLDYLAELGVGAIWLSPLFVSPMIDFGYDVSDHTDIDPIFGSLADFGRLVTELHARGLKLILDYIPNHTSDEHPWFAESRASRRSPRRDWYVWRDPAPGGGPPNNWLGEFGGAAWTWDQASEQYYYHAFLPCQPDLNWRHPPVASAMLRVLDFWLDQGVDGFRVDAIHHLFEDEGLQDNPRNPDWTGDRPPAEALLRVRTIDQPEVHGAISAMRRRLDDRGRDHVLIGEAYLPLDRLMAYYGSAQDGFHLPFNFHLMSTPWSPRSINDLVCAYETLLPEGGWPNWVLSNHDRSRLASRLGRDQARVAAMLLLTLRGTPTLYQGDELGMVDTPVPAEQVRDPWERRAPGLGLGRDPARTPMLWSDRPNARFSGAIPWLPLSDDWRRINVARQLENRSSILRLYRDLLHLRRREAALWAGDYSPVLAGQSLLAFTRQSGGRRLLVALDLAGEGGEVRTGSGRVLLSSSRTGEGDFVEGVLAVAPNNGVILALD
jgi:alpha-glucosidase